MKTRIAALVLTAAAGTLAPLGAAHATPAPDDGERRPITQGHFDPEFFQTPGLKTGVLLECSTPGEQPVRVSMYQSNGDLDVVLVEDADGIAYALEGDRRFVHRNRVFARLAVAAQPATVRGWLARAGRPVRVSSAQEAGGPRYLTRGWELPLRARLSYTHADRPRPLECGTAFAFRLWTSKRPAGS